jgi:hypothetical protein
MSKTIKMEAKAEEVQNNETAEGKEEMLDPRDFSYRPDGTVEMSAQAFELLRAYFAEQAQIHQPKKIFLHQKMVPTKSKDEKGKTINTVEWVDFASDEEYKAQKPLEYRDVDSFNIVFMNNILHDTHINNINKGNAVPKEVLREELAKEQDSRLQKVEESAE